MSCCTGRGTPTTPTPSANASRNADSRAGPAGETAPGISRIDLVVPDMHCPACMTRIERGLRGHEAVTAARVNMTTRRVAIEWHDDRATVGDFVDLLRGLGYAAHPFAADTGALEHDARRARELLVALGVAGAYANAKEEIAKSLAGVAIAVAGAAAQCGGHWPGLG